MPYQMVDLYGQPIRRRMGFLAGWVRDELSDSETDAIGTRIVMPEEPDAEYHQEGEPPQCRSNEAKGKK